MTLAQLEKAYAMVKAGALRSTIVRETGLTAEQVNELRLRAAK